MALLTDLFNTLDKPSLAGIAGAVGESEQSVSKGMQTALGTVLGGMACKSDNPTLLQKVLALIPAGSGDVSWSKLAGGVSDPNSPLISGGKRMLSTLFGGSENAVTSALGAESGFRPSVTSSLMAMAAPMVMSFLSTRMRDGGMTIGGLGTLLQRETPAIRAALPASLTDLIWPHPMTTASPVVAQTITRERRPTGRWIVPLILLALIPGLFWLFNHGRRPVIAPVAPATGTAQRAVPEPSEVTKPSLPSNVDLHFKTGSARLSPESQVRLNEYASALAANPDVHVMVNGYTDNVGNAASNLRLSQQRANAVVADLERRGISADRLAAHGFGEEHPIADNSTANGRAENRRVSVGMGEH
jgi:OOP family OmpA-OmpF porin